MRNITTPAKPVSFEDALRNLAAKLTGKPAASLPRTQEAVVQFMAENIPSVDELVREVTACLASVDAGTLYDGPESDTPGTKEAAKGRKRKPNTN